MFCASLILSLFLLIVEPPVNPYELLRMRKCIRNNAHMQKLGLPVLAQLFANTTLSPKKRQRRKQKTLVRSTMDAISVNLCKVWCMLLLCSTSYVTDSHVRYLDVCVMMGPLSIYMWWRIYVYLWWFVVICDDMNHVNLNLNVLSI
jgi:hypothetical protein